MNKQDMSGVRSAADLEQKYDLSGMDEAFKSVKVGVRKTQHTLNEFIESSMKEFLRLQQNVDGKIETWYHHGIPELDNYPSNEWDPTDYGNHVGDLYYDRDTGYGYCFIDKLRWERVTDLDTVRALALAASAQDTADSKRRIFLTEPEVPYDNGDLWIQNREIYVCQVSRENGVFDEDDFIVATRYTDDTKAIALEGELHILSGTVTEIRTSSDSFQVNIERTVAASREELDELKNSSGRELDDLSQKMGGIITNLSKHFVFSESGITISSDRTGTGDKIELQLDNEGGIVFRKNGVRFGYWNGTNFESGNIVVKVEERAQFGNFAFIPRSNGALSFIKVGDGNG